jgi:putative membrane protein
MSITGRKRTASDPNTTPTPPTAQDTQPSHGEEPQPPASPPAPAEPRTPPRTWAGSTWVTVCVALVILVALIVFVSQNSAPVKVSFLGLHGRFSLAVALLAAMAVGCLLTLVLGTTRILQLRRIVRRRHRDDLAAAGAAGPPPTADTPPSTPEPPETDGESGHSA